MTKWSQVRTKVEAKTDINLKTPKSAKHYKQHQSINSFVVRGDRFEDQHRSEIDQKTEPIWKCVLASILVDLWRVLGAKTDQKSIRKTIEKTTSKKRGPRRPKGRFWIYGCDRPLPDGRRGEGRERINPRPGDIVYREKWDMGNGQL